MIGDKSLARKPTLEELRKKANKTRVQVAVDVGVSDPKVIYDWERKGSVPRLEHAIGLARSLSVSLKTVCESLGFDLTGIPGDVDESEKAEV